MNLKELISNVYWDDVEKKLMEIISQAESFMEGYKKVFFELRELPAVNEETDHDLIITLRKEANLTDENIWYYDVCGINPEDDVVYGLDFLRWETWLSYQVDETSLMEVGKDSFVAYCLDEMTFDGFDQETIQEGAEELLRRGKEAEEHPERMIDQREAMEKIEQMKKENE